MNQSLDYYLLTREFIKELRGNHSQRELSELLELSYNKVGKWESGVTQVKWTDFLKILKALNYSIEETLKIIFYNFKGNYNPSEILSYLEAFLALQSINNDLIKKLLKKWKRNNVSPDLAEVLIVLDFRPSMLIGFLSFFIDCSKIQTIKKSYDKFIEHLNMLSEDPNVIYVNEALKVKEYRDLEKHDSKLLARHSSCSLEDLKKTLEQQVKIGYIVFDGKKYYPAPFDYSFSTLSTPKIRKFNKYTFDLVAQKYPLDRNSCLPGHIFNSSVSSNRVVALSRDASLKINQLVTKFHNEVGEIVKKDDLEKENVQIVSLASVVSAIEIDES